MQALKSPMIRSIWYIIWLVLVIISQQMEQLCLNAKGLDSVRVVFFLIIAILTLLFMFLRYQHEQHYFKNVWFGCFYLGCHRLFYDYYQLFKSSRIFSAFSQSN